MKVRLSLAVVVSAVIGFVQMCWALPFCWMYIAMYNPTPHWLIAHGMHGRSLVLALFVHDAAINILLCLPAAFVLNRLRPRHLSAYVTIAVLTGCLWEYRLLLMHPATWNEGDGGMFAYGMVLTLMMLPAAAVLVRLRGDRVSGIR